MPHPDPTHTVALAEKRNNTKSMLFSGPTALVDIAVYIRKNFFLPDLAKAYALGDGLYILIWEEQL